MRINAEYFYSYSVSVIIINFCHEMAWKLFPGGSGVNNNGVCKGMHSPECPAVLCLCMCIVFLSRSHQFLAVTDLGPYCIISYETGQKPGRNDR